MVAASLALASCDSFLDVQPKSQVEDTELFNSETGFKEALSGVYSSMVADATYSREMTFGAMAVLGHEWSGNPSQFYTGGTTSYSSLAEYDYTATLATSVIANIWSNTYNGIANVNNILKQIDDHQSVFSSKNYEIIKGEALALRAFLHFDLLRCFGVSYEVNADMPAIPYSTDLSYRVFPQLTVSQVAEKVIADLLEAEKLMDGVDPIQTGEEIREIDDNGYLMNRQVHLNYYAVKGLQARVYMWMHKYAEAEAAAKVVINSGAFPWAQLSYVSVGHDYGFATEQLFALNNIQQSTLVDYYFNEESYSYSFYLTAEDREEYYDNVTSDYRYLYLFQSGSMNEAVNYRFSLKYNNPYISQSETFSEESYYSNKMPMIRLSEMYLIVAECEYRTNGGGLNELNTLRAARNVPELTELPADFYTELIREYRRELLGEGQLFFLYKRLNRSLVIGADTDMIGQKAYTFPLPVSETDAAQRETNR